MGTAPRFVWKHDRPLGLLVGVLFPKTQCIPRLCSLRSEMRECVRQLITIEKHDFDVPPSRSDTGKFRMDDLSCVIAHPIVVSCLQKLGVHECVHLRDELLRVGLLGLRRLSRRSPRGSPRRLIPFVFNEFFDLAIYIEDNGCNQRSSSAHHNNVLS